MSRIAIAADSNSGITQKMAEELGVYILPMPFFIDGKPYQEGFNLSYDEFFRLQSEGAQISTSQPTPQDVTDFWDRLLLDHDFVLYMPMSSALSGSCATAMALAQDYDGRVLVIDNVRISVTQKTALIEARSLADDGMPPEEIRDYLLRTSRDPIIYLAVDSLKYLKQGGRITPAVASIGTLLNIKPVLIIDGGKLDMYSTCRGMRSARKKIIQALKEDISRRFHAEDMSDLELHAAGCFSREDAFSWKEELEEAFGVPCSLDRLPLSIATHTGFGAWGAGFTRKFKKP